MHARWRLACRRQRRAEPSIRSCCASRQRPATARASPPPSRSRSEPTYSPSSPASSPSTCPESPAVRGRPASRTPTNLRPKPAENPEEGPQVHLTAPTCGPNPRKTAKKGRRRSEEHPSELQSLIRNSNDDISL